MPITRQELDKIPCAECGKAGTCGVTINAKCHPKQPPIVCYEDGILYFECSVCGNLVCEIEVQGR